MIRKTLPVYDVLQSEGAKDECQFRIWVTGDALYGVVLNEGTSERDRGKVWDFGLNALSLVPGFEIVMLPLLIILSPVLLVIFVITLVRDAKNPQSRVSQVDKFDPQSDEFLNWDWRNFRLDKSKIIDIEIGDKQGGLPWKKPSQEIRIRLQSGEMRAWTLSDAHTAEAQWFKEALGIPTVTSTERVLPIT